MVINLKANTRMEEIFLSYLMENASAPLAEKINAGEKTLAGAVKFCEREAYKLANGANCVAVDRATVYGWVIHFFEEDAIVQVKDGEAPKAAKPARSKVRVPAGVRVEKPKTEPKTEPKTAPEQLSMLDALFGGGAV